MKTIAVLGTLDTKGEEHAFVAECIRALGHRPLLIDVGVGRHISSHIPDDPDCADSRLPKECRGSRHD